MLNQEIDKSDIGDVFGLVEGITTESLEQLKDDIDFFLEESKEEEFQMPKEQSNPFVALVGGYNKKAEMPKNNSSKRGQVKEEKKIISVVPDNWTEKTHLRTIASKNAKDLAFNLFDTYKKSHSMPSYD